MEFSVAMALVDYIPVVLFLLASVLLQRDLYGVMTKGAFAIFASGMVNVFSAGALKATYKLLYALNICDFEQLSVMFFPVQSLGFLLAGLGILLCLIKDRKAKVLYAAPPVFSGTFLFVTLMVAGLGMMNAGLAILAKRKKAWSAVILLAVSFCCSLCMGYLSSRDFSEAAMNWLAEGINILGQGAFLAAAVRLHRAGLGT